jgi:hypothetical protein
MYDIIKEQNIRIILETNIDLTSATLPKIIFEKPDRTTISEWTGEIVGTTIRTDLENKELDQVGWWYVHAQVNLMGELNPHYGKRASFLVKDKFTV